VLKSVAREFRFTAPKQLFTIKYVGGWTKVESRFFDPNHGVMATIEHQLGG
jgi:ABC-type sulfate transport system substrate-binding protein